MDTVKAIRVYTYRTAMAQDKFMTLPRDMCKELERELVAQLALRGADNHTCYEFWDKQNKRIFVQFSDSSAYFGNSITERSY